MERVKGFFEAVNVALINLVNFGQAVSFNNNVAHCSHLELKFVAIIPAMLRVCHLPKILSVCIKF